MFYANVQAPCYKCEDRTVGCHGNCPEYAKYIDIVETAKRKVIEENNIRNAVINNTIATMNESRRRFHKSY